MTYTTRAADRRFMKYAIVALFVMVAFFASYRYAVAARSADVPVGYVDASAIPATPAGGTASCACCGGAGSSEPIEGDAGIGDDGIQRITVDTSSGSYDPNVLRIAAGVPTEITFTAASGCLAQVMSEELGFFEDLTTGDVTVPLAPLEPGTYRFSCGMQMVFGQIVVE